MNKPKTVKRALVTGATGFIGSRLTQRLLEEKFEVGIIKRPKSDTSLIKAILNRIKIYDVDLKETRDVLKAVSDFKPGIIYHLASYYAVQHRPEEISAMFDTNILGTTNLLEASRESKVGLFVNTSSSFVYKRSEDKLKETGEISPFNLYALTKRCAEETSSFYSARYGLRCVTFRIFPPYGPHDHNRRLIPYAIAAFLRKEKPVMTSGVQKWDFIYVDDIVEAYLKLAAYGRLANGHEIFNIGTGEAVSVREIVLKIKEILKSDIEPVWGGVPQRENEIRFSCADITKARTSLKWKPRVSILEQGLKLTVDWHRKVLPGGLK